MIARKQGHYSERTVYPWVTGDDLEMDLLDVVREALRANDADHPWLSLTDDELLGAARLYGRDQTTGERGFNLAAVALLGKEETLLDVMPLYRTDAVLQRMDTSRYDDRLVCRANLVRAYDELVDLPPVHRRRPLANRRPTAGRSGRFRNSLSRHS